MEESARQSALLTAFLVLLIGAGLILGFATGAIDLASLSKSLQTPAKLPFDDPDVLYSNAADAYGRGDNYMARAAARRITYIKPDHKDAHKLLAALAMRERDYKTVAAECRKVLAIDPTDGSAQITLGSALSGQGRGKEARDLYRKVIDSPVSSKAQRDEATLRLSELKGRGAK